MYMEDKGTKRGPGFQLEVVHCGCVSLLGLSHYLFTPPGSDSELSGAVSICSLAYPSAAEEVF